MLFVCLTAKHKSSKTCLSLGLYFREGYNSSHNLFLAVIVSLKALRISGVYDMLECSKDIAS